MNERNYGIDLIRIIAMLMVVALHTLGQGGLLGAAEKLSLHYEIIWFIEISAVCACNAFAIVSGYVGVLQGRYQYANLANLWLQVFCISAGFTCAAMVLFPGHIDKGELITALTPVTSGTYWYFTAYFAMFFFIPLMNRAAKAMSGKQLLAFIIGVGLIFSCLQILAGRDIFKINDGYTCIWLMYLYMIGAYMKLYDGFDVPKAQAVLLYLSAIVFTWGLKYCFEYCETYLVSETPQLLQMAADCAYRLSFYNSPVMVIAAVAIVNACKSASFHAAGEKIIGILAPAAFGVYIIHRHPLIWKHIITGKFAVYAESSCAMMVLKIIATILTIYFAATVIQLILLFVFKQLKIKKHLQTLEKKVIKNIWQDNR